MIRAHVRAPTVGPRTELFTTDSPPRPITTATVCGQIPTAFDWGWHAAQAGKYGAAAASRFCSTCLRITHEGLYLYDPREGG